MSDYTELQTQCLGFLAKSPSIEFLEFERVPELWIKTFATAKLISTIPMTTPNEDVVSWIVGSMQTEKISGEFVFQFSLTETSLIRDTITVERIVGLPAVRVILKDPEKWVEDFWDLGKRFVFISPQHDYVLLFKNTEDCRETNCYGAFRGLPPTPEEEAWLSGTNETDAEVPTT